MDLLWFIFVTPCASLSWGRKETSMSKMFSAIISSNKCSAPFLFSFCDFYNVNVIMLDVVNKSLKLPLFLKYFCYSGWVLSLPCFPDCWSVLLQPVIVSSLYCIFHFIDCVHLWLVLSCWSSEFIHSSVWYLYDHYFELFNRQIA